MTDYIERLAQKYLSKIDDAISRHKFAAAVEDGDRGIEELKKYRKKHLFSCFFSSDGFYLEQLEKRTAFAEFCKIIHKLKTIMYRYYVLHKTEDWLKQKEGLSSLENEINALSQLLGANPSWKLETYHKNETVYDVCNLLFGAYGSLIECATVEEVRKIFDMLSFFSEEEKAEFSKSVTQRKSRSVSDFNITLLNTDTDLNRLAEQIVDSGAMQFSLCLYGAPGTGKSAYARYLAERMGIEVVLKRASDLFSKWVGESEKAIAAAFREAEEKGAMLVFDEADSFLQDRKMLSESWEVSQVNEMLTWMESTTIPFVCTTNLMSSLDKASLRRFIFKVKYDYLTPAQVDLAFKQFFGEMPKVSLGHLTKMVPGDFVVVKKKADVLKISDHQQLADMLMQEMEAKEL